MSNEEVTRGSSTSRDRPQNICRTCYRTIQEMEEICNNMAIRITKALIKNQKEDWRYYNNYGWFDMHINNYPYDTTLHNITRVQNHLWLEEPFKGIYPDQPELQVRSEAMLDARNHGEPILVASSICVILHKQASDEIKEAIRKSVIRATDESFALRGPGIMTIDEQETTHFAMRMHTLWRGMIHETYNKAPCPGFERVDWITLNRAQPVTPPVIPQRESPPLPVMPHRERPILPHINTILPREEWDRNNPSAHARTSIASDHPQFEWRTSHSS